MNILQTPVIVMSVLAWLAAPTHSLDEASQKEAMRRHMLPKSKVSVNSSHLKPDVPLTSLPPAQTQTTAAAAAPAAKPASGDTPEAHRTDDAWWRKRIADARTAVEKDQAAADGLQTHINALQRDVVNVDDPLRQAKLREDLKTAMLQLDLAKNKVTEDQASIKQIQDEARRLDVPAGWVR
jgi:septal ring factor EnvC (AmiA/AmiB activator)